MDNNLLPINFGVASTNNNDYEIDFDKLLHEKFMKDQSKSASEYKVVYVYEYSGSKQLYSKESDLHNVRYWKTVPSPNSTDNFSTAYLEFMNILTETPLNVSKDEDEDPFTINILSWMEKYESVAVSVINFAYDNNEIKDPVMSKLLILMGQFTNTNTYSSRIGKLLDYLTSTSDKIRYGAIVGLSNITNALIVPHLDYALIKENNPLLKGLLKSVIQQSR